MLFAMKKLDLSMDEKFIDNLYRTYAKMLTKLAFSIVHDKECAGDVVTNAMTVTAEIFDSKDY